MGQVRYLLLTHVHLDHAGGAGALVARCPRATVLVHPAGARHLTHPKMLSMSTRMVFGADKFSALFGGTSPVPPDRIQVVEDGATLRLGARTLSFFWTRGHANHHLCILDSRTRGLFTGDMFGASFRFLRGRGDGLIFPLTPPTEFDAAEARRSIERMLALEPERLYLAHYGAFEAPARAGERLLAALAYTEALQGSLAGGVAGPEPEARVAYVHRALERHLYRQVEELGLALGPAEEGILQHELRLNAAGVVHACAAAAAGPALSEVSQ